MPVLIILLTLIVVALVVVIVSASPRHTPAVREGLWSFARYLLLTCLAVLTPLLLMLQLTMGIMPYRLFFVALVVGLGGALGLLYAVDHVRQDFLRQQRKAAFSRARSRQAAARPPAEAVLPRDREASLRSRYERAAALLAERRFEEAILELQQLLEVEPNHADAHQALGNAFNLTGEADLALQEFHTAFTIRARKHTEHE